MVKTVFLDPTSIGIVGMHLSDDDDLAAGLVTQSSKKSSTMTALKEFLGILASADNPTPAGRAAAFISLSGNKVQVEFDTITRRFRRRVLEAIARERHGDNGVRVVRLLLETGKMDEKQASALLHL